MSSARFYSNVNAVAAVFAVFAAVLTTETLAAVAFCLLASLFFINAPVLKSLEGDSL